MNKHLSNQLREKSALQEKVAESEKRYKNLVESSPDAIAVHSKGKIVYVNEAGIKLVGAWHVGAVSTLTVCSVESLQPCALVATSRILNVAEALNVNELSVVVPKLIPSFFHT